MKKIEPMEDATRVGYQWELDPAFAANLQHALLVTTVTPQELANASHVSAGVVYNILSGRTTVIRNQTAVKLAPAVNLIRNRAQELEGGKESGTEALDKLIDRKTQATGAK